ncbi:radical SAM protein [bacterium]|nr:radical SAM protein [bacterium]MBU1071933.1 radical SAM protein [bacterium]MBU1676994.1 radical SAM protein [bacterium]
MNLPFCHVFTSGERHYAYDVNSGDVVEIDPPTAIVLAGSPGGSNATVSTDALRDARGRVVVARADQGLFLSHRPGTLTACETCHDASGYDGDVGQLTLSISDQCNLRCRYCLHGNDLDWVRPHRDARMTPRTARAAVREFLRRSRRATAPSISFYGGEPLLAPDLIHEVVALVRREGPRDDYRFNIDTNGTLLDAETVSLIVDEGLNLQVSLDGPPHIHDRYRRYRGGGPTHEAIMGGLRRLMRASSRAHELLRFQVTLLPPGNLEEIAAYFRGFPLYGEFGCAEEPSLGINAADLTGADLTTLGIAGGDFAAFAADMDAARIRYVEARVAGHDDAPDLVLRALFDGDLITFYHRHRGRLGDAISPGGCCRPGQRRLHVRADGVYQPCERVGDGLVIGDVERGIDLAAVDDLWHRFAGALGERCLDCWACRLCPLCFTALAEGWRCDGGGATVSAARCDNARARLERTLRTYVELVERNPRSLDFLETSTVS